MKQQVVWTLNVESALEFYRRAAEQKAETEEARTAILFEMTKEGLIDGVTLTHRSKDQIVSDYKKNFNVLEVKKDDDTDKNI